MSPGPPPHGLALQPASSWRDSVHGTFFSFRAFLSLLLVCLFGLFVACLLCVALFVVVVYCFLLFLLLLIYIYIYIYIHIYLFIDFVGLCCVVFYFYMIIVYLFVSMFCLFVVVFLCFVVCLLVVLLLC